MLGSIILFGGFLASFLFTRSGSLPDVIKIGGLFDSSDDEQEMAFRIAVDWMGKVLPGSRLVALSARLEEGDSYAATKNVCKLMEQGVAGVFGPQSVVTSMHVSSICDEMEVAHVETRWDDLPRRDDLSINLYPNGCALSLACVSVVKALGWQNFTIVYEENEGMIRSQHFFLEADENNWNIGLYTFEKNAPYRDVFWQMKQDLAKLKDRNQKIILDVSRENLVTVLKHAQQVGMVTENQQYLITCLDLHTLDLEDFRYGKSNIRGLRLVKESDAEYRNLTEEITARTKKKNCNVQRFGLKTETALIYDAVKVFAEALQQLDHVKKLDRFPNVSCTSDAKGMVGTSLINYMKSSSMYGMTGFITFDGSGFRSQFELDIMSLSEDGLTQIGTLVSGDQPNITKVISKPDENSLKKITTKLEGPYVMLKNSTKGLTGNGRYEGFCVDLVEELSKVMNFSYEILAHKDISHGEEINGTWDGLIGEVMNKKADMAVAALSINFKRERAVDFTMPFINTGISILFRKPTTKVKSLFSFLSPFSGEVWIYLTVSYLAVSIVMYWVGRLTPYEWLNNFPCRQDDVIVENTFNFRNSLWFMMGCLMQQGSDLVPSAFCTRTVASFWYFFTLIMVSSYTANLAAFLTIEKDVYPIRNVRDLANQTKIKYGCSAKGATNQFFKDSKDPMFKRMHDFMGKYKGFFHNSEEGVDKVQEGNFAFFMESVTIEYYTERRCNLTQIGGLIDSKGYGIAVKKGNRDLVSKLSSGILKLQEDGTIHKLREKWWKQKGRQCGFSKQYASNVSKLGLRNVGGVFVVLIFGLIVAILIALFEFWWKTRHIDNPNQVSFWGRLKPELKFALLCGNSTKPASSYRKSLAPQSNVNSRSSIPSQVTNRSV